LEVILSELDENAEAWVLKDVHSGKYVIIPDTRYPGRKPVRFFMRREDAEAVLMEMEYASFFEKDKGKEERVYRNLTSKSFPFPLFPFSPFSQLS